MTMMTRKPGGERGKLDADCHPEADRSQMTHTIKINPHHQVFNAKCSSVQCKVFKCSMQGVQCKVFKVFKSQPSQCGAITSYHNQPANTHPQDYHHHHRDNDDSDNDHVDDDDEGGCCGKRGAGPPSHYFYSTQGHSVTRVILQTKPLFSLSPRAKCHKSHSLESFYVMTRTFKGQI